MKFRKVTLGIKPLHTGVVCFQALAKGYPNVAIMLGPKLSAMQCSDGR